MGGADVAAGEAILNRAGIPTFPYPDTAARAFNAHVALQPTTCAALYETPTLAGATRRGEPDRDRAAALIAGRPRPPAGRC